ncbi:aminotransferase class I/II-fold pyridoxal phosphate-dependent enzyme [Nibricoccus sp. IMCC34717]|uniref:aminotransferase class I/II-fold pyridoxal phosphate-dependent enzyme n=1 Tax=Nibricoccus sp. IMCC34717 TaxID=3034021 RepID=UPI00384F6F64
MKPPLRFLTPVQVEIRGRRLAYFAGSNYLGLSSHPSVLKAFSSSEAQGFIQPGASRATTGEQLIYRQAERALARFFQMEDAVLTPCGYLAPFAALHAATRDAGQVLLDDAAHACVRDAAIVSGKQLHHFPHADTKSIRRLAKESAVLACDGTFGVKGGHAPIAEYREALGKEPWLVVDDAHGAGTVGPGGRGLAALLRVPTEKLVLTISLSKAFGIAGGAVIGPREIIERIRIGAPAFVGTTSIPIAIPAALQSVLRILTTNKSLVTQLQTNAKRIHSLLPQRQEILSHPQTPVFAVYPSSPTQLAGLKKALSRAKIYPPFIRYLSGPAGGFFRFSVSAHHSFDDLALLAEALGKGLLA